MKKFVSVVLVCALLICMIPSVFSADEQINVKIYGAPQKFDVMPIMQNDRVLVPMRAIFEKLGAKVDWDEATQTVTGTKIGKEVKLKIGDTTATVDGKSVTLDVPATIVNDRTMVPVRFISESMGAKVDWDNDTNTVIVQRGQTTNIDKNDGRELEDLGLTTSYDDSKFADIEGANVRRPVPTEFEKSSDLNDLLYYPQPKDPEEVFKGLTGGETLVTTESFFDMPMTGAEFSTFSVVDVDGMPFTKALDFNSVKIPEKSYKCAVEVRTDKQFNQGDVGMLVLYTRLISGGSNDSGEGHVEVTLQETATTGYKAAIQSHIYFGTDWKVTYIPFSVSPSVANKPLRMHIRPAHEIQEFQVGGYCLMNFGSKYKIEDMPDSSYYKGMEEDAQWRKDALAKIEQIRKGDITVTVKDKDGNVIPDADVKLDMYESEFEWGTAISTRLLREGEDGENYRKNLVKYFNGAVVETEHKWNYYENDPVSANSMVDWSIRNGIKNFRVHALLWDRKYDSTTKNSAVPPDVGKWIESKDYDKIKARFEKHIYEQAGDFAGRVTEFDVINEMTRGDAWFWDEQKDIISKAFEWARKAAPNEKLFFNECGLSGTDSKAYKKFTEILDWAVANNVDFDGIGIQGHQGNPKDPLIFLDMLNKFAEKYPDKELKVTEFDILLSGSKLNDDLQANFCRDILIAMYSCENLSGIYNWGMWDNNNAGRLILSKDWKVRKAGKEYEDLVYNKWWTRDSGKTNADGVYSTRGYFGDYDITVTANGQTKTADVRLYKNSDKNIVITMD